MKKIIIAAVCAFCALTASAQRASSSSSSFFSTEKVDGAAFSLVSVQVSTWQAWIIQRTM